MGEMVDEDDDVPDQLVAQLVRAIDMRDTYTGQHSSAVGELARRVGRRLGMRNGELWLVVQAARLHDVGKLGVPDTVLNKPGPLDDEEWAAVRSHAELGADIVSRVRGLEPVARFVRAHHERWDGRGYPDGLAAGDIPLASRIVAACDAFHAMTTDRPYRAALTIDEALAELDACSGTQFDPGVVAAIRKEALAAAL